MRLFVHRLGRLVLARALLRKAAQQFRTYEEHHKAKLRVAVSGSDMATIFDLEAKVRTNRELAEEIEAFLG